MALKIIHLGKCFMLLPSIISMTAHPDDLPSQRPNHISTPMMLKILLSAFLCSASLCYANSPVECKRVMDVERLLEVSEREIDSNTCNLSPVTKPTQGPRGTRAKWTLAGASVAGLPLTTTLFVAQGRVRRIEQVWASTDLDCASIPNLNLVANALNERFGAPLGNVCKTQRAEV
jgi:hypothetical protein